MNLSFSTLKLRFPALLVVSALLRVGLILYSEWHDARSVVKYTDIDYRVFSDAARFLFNPDDKGNVAQGPLGNLKYLNVGNPYNRDTYRYTPLLALLLLPNQLVHASFGKYLFAACDLVNGVLIYRLLLASVLSRPPPQTAEATATDVDDGRHRSGQPHAAHTHAWATALAATHLLNPLVFTISTRGSSESILCTLVLLTLYYALRRQWDLAAVMLGISTHWKIYPVIYGVSCVAAIASARTGLARSGLGFARSLVCVRTIRFAVLSAGTFFSLGILCYLVWGRPFLYEAYLYHADRLDHRHNFSPNFYLTYLTYPGQSATSGDDRRWNLRSPLTSLVPQLALSLGTGLLLGRRTQDLPFAWFVQTFAFVLFNRVCTSQYFLWYTLFLPLLAPHIRLSWRTITTTVAVWVGTQAIWLAEAYKLEFLGQDVFFGLWVRSLLYVGGHAWVLGKVMQGYTMGTMS